MSISQGTVHEINDNDLPEDLDWNKTLDFVLNQITDEDLEMYFDSFSYQGFDATFIRRLALKKTEGELLPIVQILSLTLKQGTNLSKLDESLNDSGKMLFSTLKGIFNLSYLNGSTNKVPRNVITVQRLQSAFPELSAIIISKMFHVTGHTAVSASYRDMRDHPWLYFPSAPSIIPHDREDLIDEWKTWAAKFDKTINRKKTDRDEGEQEDFFDIIHDSTLFSDRERTSLISRIEGLTNDFARGKKSSS
jgi:hypothetical protein